MSIERDAFDEMIADQRTYHVTPGHYTAVRPLIYTGPRDNPTLHVAVVSCHRCGAALTLDIADDVDVVDLHETFHERTDPWPTN